ncbi:aquaporin-like protein [Haematococcus lacustris]
MKMPAIHLRWAARDKYLWMSLLAEFVGTALFQLLGATSADNPLQSAFSLGAIMYATKYISGGHLNPAVSLAALMSGHIDYVRGLAYIAAQMLGAVGGAVMQAFLSPDSEMGKLGPGCFAPMKSLTNWGLFGWETLLTFLFIAVMYAAIFVRPGHGDAAPLAAALALFAALSTGGSFTGGSPLNPARVFAGALVFKCFWRWAFVYICAQLTAAVMAAGWAVLVFGKGDFFRHPSAMENLREGLLGGASAVAGEPTGSTFAPTGHHYAGSVITDAAAHGAL